MRILLPVILGLIARGELFSQENAWLEEVPIIDTHVHAMTPEYFFGDAPVYSIAGARPEPTFERVMFRTMQLSKNSGIKYSLVVGLSPLTQAWKEQYPSRTIRSYFPPLHDNPSFRKDREKYVEEFRTGIASGEFGAIGELTLGYEKIGLDDPIMFPFYEVAEESTKNGRPIPVFLHTGSPKRMKMDQWSRPKLMEKAANEFPDTIFVACHAGGNKRNLHELIRVMKDHPNIYTENSATNWGVPGVTATVINAFKEAHLLDRFMYGSDQQVHPDLVTKSVAEMRKMVREGHLTKDEYTMVMWGNSARILGLEE